MTLMDKKLSELTEEQIKSLRKPIGMAGMPYPMMKATADASGVATQELGVISNMAESMVVYTEMDLERVQGRFFREMPIPSMLLAQRDLIAKQAPDSSNWLWSVFGDPAFGKSYLFKMVASIVHPKGPIHVDCGGLNMHEVFFRTVIDYGAGVQDSLNKRLAAGKVKPDTIKYLNANFPGSVVTKDGKSVIDWDRIGARETQTNEEGDQKAVEDRRDGYVRGVECMKAVYEMEGITYQANSFGIKTVPGEFFDAWWSGRPLFLDEINKCKAGTLDCFQTFSQFMNGEEPSVTIRNSMAQSDDEGMKEITVVRADRKPAFIIGLAGNEGRDGDTTKELSESFGSRIDPHLVGNPSEADWGHRISQVWTGLPLTTLYEIHQEFADNNPDQFAEALIELRTLGMTPEERLSVPEREIYWLKHWKDTREFFMREAKCENHRFLLSMPESEVANKAGDLSEELGSDQRRKQIRVTFRRIIADHARAIENMPAVSDKSTGLGWNIREAFERADLGSLERREPGWYRSGEHFADRKLEELMNACKDMPGVLANLVSVYQLAGIIPVNHNEAKVSDMKLAKDLMKYDELKEEGGTDELKADRALVTAVLRSKYPKITATDEQLVSLHTLARVKKVLAEASAASDPAVRQVILPNDDYTSVKAEPLVAADVVASYTEGVSGTDTDFRSILAAMAIPDYADKNRENLWLGDLTAILEEPDQPLAEHLALTGKAQNGLNIGAISALNSVGETVYLYLLEDKNRKQSIVIGPEALPPQLLTDLDKNGITYLMQSDEATQKRVDAFMAESAELLFADVEEPDPLQTGKVVEDLMTAFRAVCGDGDLPPKYLKPDDENPGQMMVIEGTTIGLFLADRDTKPELYTRVFAKKDAKSTP